MAKKTAKELIHEAEALIRAGRHDLAPGRFREAIRLVGDHPETPRIRARLGEVLLRNGAFDEAAEIFERLLAAGANREHRFRLAQAHAFAGRRDEAGVLVDLVMPELPDDPREIARVSTLLQSLGREPEAVALLDSAVAKGMASREIANAFSNVAIKAGRVADAVDLLRPHTEDRALPPKDRGVLLFTLARLLDTTDRTDEAWEAITAANELTRRPWDAEAFEARIDLLIERFTVDAVRSIAQEGEAGARAVLIVGMPRSGTTLIERILGAHPAVAMGGELRALHDAVCAIPGTKEDEETPPLNRVRGGSLNKARKSYLAALDRVSLSADRVTDKMPHNLRHLGLVPAVLPGATVIRCTRDLRDTALSCYFRGFVSGNNYSHDLRWIARFTRAYLRLDRHWSAVLPEACPDLRLLEAEYERVSQDPEAESRRLVEGVGLPWDDACTAIEKVGKVSTTLEPDQMRRGVYASSVERWRRYEARLAPFVEAMGDELR